MLKQRIINVVVAIALIAAVTGASGIVADALGLSGTSQAFACQEPASSGGGC